MLSAILGRLLISETKGVALVETALVAPFLALTIMGRWTSPATVLLK